ncbi:MAG: hypothetical protein AAFZ91_05380 [Pseudomonadota bacterium]
MSEMVLEFGLQNAVEEAAFVKAVYSFSEWISDASEARENASDAPDVMIKTVCAPDGTLKKAVTFQNQSWAQAFMDFWTRTRCEAA